MRENPNPDINPEKQVFKGENQIRITGDTLALLKQNKMVWDYQKSKDKAMDLNSLANPTFTEKACKQLEKKQTIEQ